VGWDGIVSIVTCYGLDGAGIRSQWGEIFHACPGWPWCSPSLPYNWPFPVVKLLGCVFNHPPQPNAESKEGVELYLYSPSVPLWQVIGVNLTCDLCCILLRIFKHDNITGLPEIRFVGFHVSFSCGFFVLTSQATYH
jgi:hypothetical protein